MATSLECRTHESCRCRAPVDGQTPRLATGSRVDNLRCDDISSADTGASVPRERRRVARRSVAGLSPGDVVADPDSRVTSSKALLILEGSRKIHELG